MANKTSNICKIYEIVCSKTDEKYIGQTWNTIQFRFKQHKRDPAEKLALAFEKYGVANFEIRLLAFCETQKDADKAEDLYIHLFDAIKNGWNSKGGGSNGKLSDELKQKLSEARVGRFCGEEHPMYGKKHTPESIEYMSLIKRGENNPGFGKPRSKDAIDKTAKANTGRGSGTIGSAVVFLGEAPWSRASIPVPHAPRQTSSDETRLEAARAAWRAGFQERVESVKAALSLSSNEDLPTPMAEGDE